MVKSLGIKAESLRKDLKFTAKLRVTSKLLASVLHSGNYKQNVPVTLVVMVPSTISDKHYLE